MKMKKLMLAVMAMAAASAFGAFSYQGALKLADGAEVTDLTKTITLRIYANPSDNNVLWAGVQTVMLAAKTGLFNIEVNDVMTRLKGDDARLPIDDVIAAHANETLYLGIEVAGSAGEIRPRQKLLAVPTASFAHNVKKAADNFTVMGGTVCQGPVEAQTNVTVRGNVMAGGNITVAGNITAEGPVTLKSATVGEAQFNVPTGLDMKVTGAGNFVSDTPINTIGGTGKTTIKGGTVNLQSSGALALIASTAVQGEGKLQWKLPSSSGYGAPFRVEEVTVSSYSKPFNDNFNWRGVYDLSKLTNADSYNWFVVDVEYVDTYNSFNGAWIENNTTLNLHLWNDHNQKPANCAIRVLGINKNLFE